MNGDAQREKDYRRRVRRSRFGLRLVRSAGRKKRGWLDRLRTWLLRRVTAPARSGAGFMRDEIVDADIGFEAEELERYQKGTSPDS